MANETPSRMKAFAWHAIVAAFAILGPAQAQTSLRYAETIRLQAPAGYLSYEARVINDAGEVGGYALKSAGKTWRLVARDDAIDGYFPLARLFRLPQWVSTDNFEAYPVVWKAGVPQVLKRYGGNYGTWIMDTAGPNWLVATAYEAGKINTVESRPEYLERPLGSVPRTLTPAGVYSEVVPFVRYSFNGVKINDAGSVLVDVSPDALITVAGQTTPIKLPDAQLVFRRLAGLGNGNLALVEGYGEPYQYLKRCFVWKAGELKEITVPASEPVVSVNCGAMNKDGLVVGAIYAWGPNGIDPYSMRRALFTWKDGQVLSVGPFTTGDAETFVPAGVTRAGVAVSNDGPQGTVVYPGGTTAPLGPLLGLTLRPDETAAVVRVNDAGQILLKVSVYGDARPVSYRVYSPR